MSKAAIPRKPLPGNSARFEARHAADQRLLTARWVLDYGCGPLPQDSQAIREAAWAVIRETLRPEGAESSATALLRAALQDMDLWLANTRHDEDHPWRVSIRKAIADAEVAQRLAIRTAEGRG